MDFGIAHVEYSTLTQDGAVLGTPRDMSPEQIRGDKVDGLSDIFSLGVIVDEMAAGNRPFLGRITGNHLQPHSLADAQRA
jgi:serine/threonine-protein kinase